MSNAMPATGGRWGRGWKTHGQSKTRLYRIWASMKQRCCCAYSTSYPYYGARGITVCGEWMASFEAFRDWALANGYENDREIDRRDTNGNYEPGNCRWVTLSQQMGNRRKRGDAKASKHKGVYFNKRTGRWYAQICVDLHNKHLGCFANEADAAKAYDAAFTEARGAEFATGK